MPWWRACLEDAPSVRAAFKALATGSLTLRWVFQEFIQKNLFLNFVSVLLHLFIFSIGVHRILPTPAVASEGTLCACLVARLFSFPSYPMRIFFGTFQQFHLLLAPSPCADPKVYSPTLPQESAVSPSPTPPPSCAAPGTPTLPLSVFECWCELEVFL